MGNCCFDEAGQITLTTEFAYSELDERFNPGLERMIEQRAKEEAIQMEAQVIGKLARWLGTTKNKDGIACRGIVLNWLYDSLQHESSLTEVAGQYGLKKQSVGRWVDDFKREFPKAVVHLKHLRNHER